jgi:two-component system, chemotaxis family, response regulator Rcp1
MTRSSKPEPFEILLVEDNRGDIRLTEEIFQECGVLTHLSVARDGEEAMACLRREGRYAGTPRPDLILLDLNLPKKDGHEVLAELKADPGLRRIPVVVLTTSSADRDIIKSYDLHANCYLIKPAQLDEFIAIVQSIKSFWLQIVQLPNQGG